MPEYVFSRLNCNRSSHRPILRTAAQSVHTAVASEAGRRDVRSRHVEEELTLPIGADPLRRLQRVGRERIPQDREVVT